jgi:hypothetical protein
VTIRSVSNNSFMVNQSISRKTDSNETQETKDKIEISSEAKGLAATEMGSQRLQEIREKIDSKFYDSDEVLTKVADKLIKDITK